MAPQDALGGLLAARNYSALIKQLDVALAGDAQPAAERRRLLLNRAFCLHSLGLIRKALKVGSAGSHVVSISSGRGLSGAPMKPWRSLGSAAPALDATDLAAAAAPPPPPPPAAAPACCLLVPLLNFFFT